LVAPNNHTHSYNDNRQNEVLLFANFGSGAGNTNNAELLPTASGLLAGLGTTQFNDSDRNVTVHWKGDSFAYLLSGFTSPCYFVGYAETG
jgi:hypothetical protein